MNRIRLLFAVKSKNNIFSAAPFCQYFNYVEKTALQVNVTATKCGHVNPLTAKLFNLNFHLLEVVDRDPQLQASKNYSDLTKWRATRFKSCWLMVTFYLQHI